MQTERPSDVDAPWILSPLGLPSGSRGSSKVFFLFYFDNFVTKCALRSSPGPSTPGETCPCLSVPDLARPRQTQHIPHSAGVFRARRGAEAQQRRRPEGLESNIRYLWQARGRV